MKSVVLLILLYNLRIDTWSQNKYCDQGKTSHSPKISKSTSKDIDLLALDISFKVIKEATVDKIKVTGIIKNIGKADFISGKGQQWIQLWETFSTYDRKLVKTIHFSKLKSQEELSIVFEKKEFSFNESGIPEYEMIIVYDTDIYRDTNLNNNDASLTNNRIIRKPQLGQLELKVNHL